ncbi:MAG: SsrA-binding protein SmpB [Clostridia bacterium]|nr:SsrA-binding protein SmpB [Eubacteriales bacterium]NCC49369.1 SsrA-binding protein SmpB [Clostridia bacterium]
MADRKTGSLIAENRKAYHDYFIEERFEAGIELAGTEVKSIRQRQVNLADSYAVIKDGELWLQAMHISPYEQGNRFNRDPMRSRRLLMHKREIMRLHGVTRQKGLTLVPTKLYFKNGRVKVEISLARGKKNYDKRDTEARRQADRAIERRLKGQTRD